MTKNEQSARLSREEEAHVTPPSLSRKALIAGYRPDLSGAERDFENALTLMQPEMDSWLQKRCADLYQAVLDFVGKGSAALPELVHTLQDMRSQSGPMGFPLASRAAQALSQLLEFDRPAPTAVLIAHVDAIRAIVGSGARGAGDALSNELVETLEEFGALWRTPASE